VKREEKKKKILEFLKDNKGRTAKEITVGIGTYYDSKIYYILQELQEADLIEYSWFGEKRWSLK